jgi:hypothetical protein
VDSVWKVLPYREYVLVVSRTGMLQLFTFNTKHELSLSKHIEIKDVYEDGCMTEPFISGVQFTIYNKCRKTLHSKNINSNLNSPFQPNPIPFHANKLRAHRRQRAAVYRLETSSPAASAGLGIDKAVCIFGEGRGKDRRTAAD